MFNQRARSFVTGCVGCGELRNAFFHRFTRALATSSPAVKDTTPRDFEQIPSPKGLPFIGTTFSLLLAGGPTQLHKYMDRRHKELGPIFKDNVGPVTAVFLSDAEEMRNVFAKEGKYPHNIKPDSWLTYNKKHGCTRGLFFMEGEEWWRYRRIMNNYLLKGDFTWMEASCQIVTDRLIDRINNNLEREFPNLHNTLFHWTINSMMAILVGPRTFEKSYQDLEWLTDMLASKVCMILKTTFPMQLLTAEFAEKYQLGMWKRFEDTVTEALNVGNVILDFVRTQFKETDGLLNKMKSANIEEKLADEILVDLMLSASDTTSNTMAWSLYHLGRNNRIQDQLRQDFEYNKKSALLRNIIKETLRLYPPAAFLTRVLPESTRVCGYNIPKETLVLMSIFTTGRDERYFKNPNTFNPDRWLRQNEDFPKITATLPFGTGTRSCIGKKIAEIQMQDTIRAIVQNFRIQLENEEEIEAAWKMILMPSKPIRLRFYKL